MLAPSLSEAISLIKSDQGEHSPLRMQAVLAIARRAVAGHFEVQGLENLDLIEKGEPAIAATSHHTDVDVPFAGGAIAKNVDVAITNMSLLHSPRHDIVSWMGITLGGSKNFLPIDYNQQAKMLRPSVFNPGNFTPMVDAINNGKRVLMAAYSPPNQRDGKIIKPGIGVPYLAALTEAKILPIEVIMHDARNLALTETMFKTMLIRPAFTVVIGEPFNLPELSASSESQAVAGMKQELREHGEVVVSKLNSLRQLLPLPAS